MTAPDAFSFEEGPCIPADHAGYDLLPRCRGEGGDVSVLFLAHRLDVDALDQRGPEREGGKQGDVRL